MTISSASRDRCVAQIAAIDRNSSAKSRSDTLSSELRVGSRKPSALAVLCRSMGKPVPASAAAPSGLSSMRSMASRTRDRSRREHLDIGHAVMAEGHRLRRLQMGEAGHHGRGMFLGARSNARSAPSAPRRCGSTRPCTQSRKSMATWSLRERAVCSRPAAGPISSASRASTFMWMSSSRVENSNVAGLDLSQIVFRP